MVKTMTTTKVLTVSRTNSAMHNSNIDTTGDHDDADDDVHDNHSNTNEHTHDLLQAPAQGLNVCGPKPVLLHTDNGWTRSMV